MRLRAEYEADAAEGGLTQRGFVQLLADQLRDDMLGTAVELDRGFGVIAPLLLRR